MKPLLVISGAVLCGLLSAAQVSQARIIYTQVNESVSAPGTLAIDLNNDGKVDFTLQAGISGNVACFFGYVNVATGNGDGVASVFGPSGGYWAQAFDAGAPIGPGRLFSQSLPILTQYDLGPYCFEGGYDWGYWLNAGNHYLGLAFVKNGKTRYGWAELSVTRYVDHPFNRQHLNVTLIGYAYQTNVGQLIPTGKT